MKYVTHVYLVIGNQTKFLIHKVWWLWEASQIRQAFIPHKTQYGRIPIDQVTLSAIGHRFIAKKTTANLKCRCVGLRQRVLAAETRSQRRFFFFWLKWELIMPQCSYLIKETWKTISISKSHIEGTVCWFCSGKENLTLYQWYTISFLI